MLQQFQQAFQTDPPRWEDDDALLVFRPVYHPAVRYVKELFLFMLREMNASILQLDAFTYHFNKEISETVRNTFGETPYEKHLEEVRQFRLEEAETDFLMKMKELGRIGLQQEEFRNFNSSQYVRDSKLGIIDSFLKREHKIDIEKEPYRKRKFMFLMDSLDESGELSKSSVEKVIQSIRRINNLDEIERRDNRILISSRPFDQGLEDHLREFGPFTIRDEQENEIPQFISLYGFKKDQFNHWLTESLRTSLLELGP